MSPRRWSACSTGAWTCKALSICRTSARATGRPCWSSAAGMAGSRPNWRDAVIRSKRWSLQAAYMASSGRPADGAGAPIRAATARCAASSARQLGRLQPFHDRRDALLERRGDVDRDRVRGGLEGRELAVEQRCRHVTVLARFHALANQLGGAVQVDNSEAFHALGQPPSINVLER